MFLAGMDHCAFPDYANVPYPASKSLTVKRQRHYHIRRQPVRCSSNFPTKLNLLGQIARILHTTLIHHPPNKQVAIERPG